MTCGSCPGRDAVVLPLWAERRQRRAEHRVELLGVLDHQEVTDVLEHDCLDTVPAHRVDVGWLEVGVDRHHRRGDVGERGEHCRLAVEGIAQRAERHVSWCRDHVGGDAIDEEAVSGCREQAASETLDRAGKVVDERPEDAFEVFR